MCPKLFFRLIFGARVEPGWIRLEKETQIFSISIRSSDSGVLIPGLKNWDILSWFLRKIWHLGLGQYFGYLCSILTIVGDEICNMAKSINVVWCGDTSLLRYSNSPHTFEAKMRPKTETSLGLNFKTEIQDFLAHYLAVSRPSRESRLKLCPAKM